MQSLLASRLDRLAERGKQLLQTAAVIGVEFAQPLLAEVASVPEAELDDALRELVGAEFLYELSLYPAAEYAFKHPLTQEVALGSLLHERRAEIHREVARVLEANPTGDEGERALDRFFHDEGRLALWQTLFDPRHDLILELDSAR